MENKPKENKSIEELLRGSRVTSLDKVLKPLSTVLPG